MDHFDESKCVKFIRIESYENSCENEKFIWKKNSYEKNSYEKNSYEIHMYRVNK